MSAYKYKLGGGKVFWGSTQMPRVSQDGITVSVTRDVVHRGSAESGETPLKDGSYYTNNMVEITLNFIEFDKAKLYEVLAMSEANTDANNLEAGAMYIGSPAGKKAVSKPLFIFPYFEDDTTGEVYVDENNAYAFVLSWAVPTGDFEMLLSPTEFTEFPVTFVGQYDPDATAGRRVGAFGASGITVADSLTF